LNVIAPGHGATNIDPNSILQVLWVTYFLDKFMCRFSCRALYLRRDVNHSQSLDYCGLADKNYPEFNQHPFLQSYAHPALQYIMILQCISMLCHNDRRLKIGKLNR
jgi:hypothetical protein